MLINIVLNDESGGNALHVIKLVDLATLPKINFSIKS